MKAILKALLKVAAMNTLTPHSGPAYTAIRHLFGRICAALCLVFMIGGCGAVPREQNRDRGQPGSLESSTATTLLVASPQQINLGTVEKGGRHQATFLLQNRGTQSVELKETRSSCDCLTVDLPRTVLDPGENLTATIRADFSHDPHFTGSLRVELAGNSATAKEPVYVVTVDVEVQ